MARILIVDDEPGILKMLKINLEMEGHDVMLAADGYTALRRIETESPDVVLLDIMMPVVDGWEVLRNLRSQKLRYSPKVIVMTAKTGETDQSKGISLGAEEYIRKPFDIEHLLSVIQEVMERV